MRDEEIRLEALRLAHSHHKSVQTNEDNVLRTARKFYQFLTDKEQEGETE